MLIAIAPRKQLRKSSIMLPPTVKEDKRILIVAFDYTVRVKKKGGACSTII